MQIKPILAALRHHKAGTVLIALQIALTLAIVCNALFVIHQRVTNLSRQSGIDEANLVVVENQWVGKSTKDENASRMAADLATLRQVSGVTQVYATNSYPLSGRGWTVGMGYIPDKQAWISEAAIYFADENTLSTLGLKLIAGRNFHADEISHIGNEDRLEPSEIIVTKDLADRMFPHGNALGNSVYISAKPSTIIGIIEHLQVPYAAGSEAKWAGRSTLVPYQLLNGMTDYVLRVKPGQLADVVRAAPKALMAANRLRVISPIDGVQSFSEIRGKAYKSDRGMVILMSAICVVLLAITAAGIVGLTSFWVSQRRKQIGIRRALGATQHDILNYFLTENLLIGTGGVVMGTVFAFAINLWLMKQFEMDRLALGYLMVGVIVVLLLGQGAVLAPALRASHVPPVEATR